MKKLILILLSLYASLSSSDAQKISFTDPTNEWYVSTRTEAPGQPNRFPVTNEKFHYQGDTTINNLVYNKLQNIWKYVAALVRYDSADNKVYVYNSSGDYVLYDYNLNIGDTFYSPNAYYNTGIYYTVTTKDSMLVNNVLHARWILKVTDTAFVDVHGESYVVVEGLGCLNAPLDPLFGDRSLVYYYELNRWITCFKNNGSYPSPYSSCSDSLVKILLDVEAPASIQNTLVVYPQPATRHAIIKFAATVKTGTIYLFNQVGQTIHTETIHDKSEVKVNAPALPGLYYYRITDNTTGKAWQGKLLFE